MATDTREIPATTGPSLRDTLRQFVTRELLDALQFNREVRNAITCIVQEHLPDEEENKESLSDTVVDELLVGRTGGATGAQNTLFDDLASAIGEALLEDDEFISNLAQALCQSDEFVSAFAAELTPGKADRPSERGTEGALENGNLLDRLADRLAPLVANRLRAQLLR